MKKKIIGLLIFSVILQMATAQPKALRKVNNEAFQRGEVLKFNASYDAYLTGKVTVGEAILEITKDNKQIAGRNTLRIVGTGKSRPFFDYFFKVRDRYETILDEDAIAPWVFIRRVDEGGYKISQDVIFNQYKNIAYNNKVPTKVPDYIQDIISAFYFARTFDVNSLKPGIDFPINFFIDDSVYITRIRYLGKETITTRLGTFKCIKVKPLVLTGKFFKEPYPMTLWISDDKNHIPILAESGIVVGTVKLELYSYSGLRNPLTSKIK